MGKWSGNGIDEVLAGKIATVIDSVNARIKLDAENEAERAAPPAITYEQFVEELDLGDSFTSCLFEALVKEMAERRTRTQQAERRMISRKTQKMLANLSDQTRVLKDEPRAAAAAAAAARRPSVRAAFYSEPIPGLDWEEDELNRLGGMMDAGDDDASEPMLDAEALAETTAGARRVAEQLYESYYNTRPFRQIPSFSRLPSAERTAAAADDVWGIERMFRSSSSAAAAGGAGGGGNTQTANTASGAGVGRQPSIRRTARNRAVDFSDFAARRRQTNRLGLAMAADAEAATQRGGPDEPTASSSSAAGGPPTLIPASDRTHRFGDLHAFHSAFAAGGGTSAARAMSSSSRLRRTAASLGPESFLLRSVSPPPPPPMGGAFYPREATRTPSADSNSNSNWVFDLGADDEQAARTAEPQMLTPRSSTPDDTAPLRHTVFGLPSTSNASVAGSSHVPASP